MSVRQASAESGPIRHQSGGSSHDLYIRRDYHYPQVPITQQPAPVHLAYNKRASEGQTTETTKVRGSVSSTSGSSGILRQKQMQQQQCSSLRRSSVAPNNEVLYHTRVTSWRNDSPIRSAHAHKRSEMTQHTSSPALEYVRERRRLEEEDDAGSEVEEEDHALWVLVCCQPESLTPDKTLTSNSSGYPALIQSTASLDVSSRSSLCLAWYWVCLSV